MTGSGPSCTKCDRIDLQRVLSGALAIALAAAHSVTFEVPLARSQWLAGGTLVSSGPGDKSAVDLVGDSERGVYVLWNDSGAGRDSSNVFLHRIGPDGAPAFRWPAGGINLTPIRGDQYATDMTPGTHGSVYLVWNDGRRLEDNHDVYGICVLANGGIAPGWSTSGVRLTSGGGYILAGPTLSEDDHGVLAAWLEHRPHAVAIVVQRLAGPSGLPAPWTPSAALAREVSINKILGLMPDGDGGAFVVWTASALEDPGSIWIHHVLQDGSFDPRLPEQGEWLASGRFLPLSPLLALDPVGGFFLAWLEPSENDTNGSIIRLIHILSDGRHDPRWPAGGIAMSAGRQYFGVTQVVPADDGGCFLARLGDREEEFGLYVERLDASGDRIAGSPQAVSADNDAVTYHMLSSDERGGAIVEWGDGSTTSAACRAQRFDELGRRDPNWPAGGVVDGPGGVSRKSSRLLPDGDGGAFVLWRETANAYPKDDIVLQRVLADGRVASDAVFPAPTCGEGTIVILPNPIRTGARFCLGSSVVDRTSPSLQLIDATGRVVRQWRAGEVEERGIDWDGTGTSGERVTSGIYWLRVQEAGRTSSHRLVVTR